MALVDVFEVWILPDDPSREQAIKDVASRHGATFYCREEPNEHVRAVVLTFECQEGVDGDAVQRAIRNETGAHVVGAGSWDQ